MESGDEEGWAALAGSPSPPPTAAATPLDAAPAAPDGTVAVPLPPSASPPPHALTIRTHAAAGLAAKVWPSALRLAAVAAAAPGAWRGATVVELGCGPGAAGLALAALGAHVLLTDLEGALPLARANAALNAPIIAAAGGSAVVAALPWGEPGALASAAASVGDPRFASPSAVVAADVVYDGALFEPLVATLVECGAAADPPPRIVVAHVRRWKRDARFWAAARRAFTVVELDGAGEPAGQEEEEGGRPRSAHERGALRVFGLTPRGAPGGGR